MLYGQVFDEMFTKNRLNYELSIRGNSKAADITHSLKISFFLSFFL